MKLEQIEIIKNRLFKEGLSRPNRLIFLLEMLEEDFYQEGIENYDKMNRIKENRELQRSLFKYIDKIEHDKDKSKRIKKDLIFLLKEYNKKILVKTLIQHKY